MAGTTPCKACGNPVSTAADKCPACGHPTGIGTAKNVGEGCQNLGCALMMIPLAVIGIIILVGVVGC